MNAFTEATARCVHHGWPVVPPRPGAKKPPLTRNGPKDARTDQGAEHSLTPSRRPIVDASLARVAHASENEALGQEKVVALVSTSTGCCPNRSRIYEDARRSRSSVGVRRTDDE
jgi:hypothetical protein